MNMTDWHPANNGTGKRMWFVCRDRAAGDPNRGVYGSTEYHYGKGGYLIRFSSHEAAKRRADQLKC